MYFSKKSFLSLIFFVLMCGKIISQDTLNAAYIEQKSYQLYVDKNWSELIKFGNQALKSGIDYYYLQIRLGIAYYEEKNYAIAETHFKESLFFNSEDELAKEYLYYCYIYNGRNEEARKLSNSFSEALIKKVDIKEQSKVGFFLVEAGTKVANQTGYYNQGTNTNSNYFNSPLYFQIGLNHYVKNKFSLFHAITKYNQVSFIGNSKQTQYYIKASIPLKNNWLLSPSIHVLNSKLITETATPPSTLHVGPPPRKIITETTSNSIIGSVSIQKTINKYTLSAGSLVSNIANKSQIIHNGFISYSVFGNPKLILGCTGYVHTLDSYATTYAAVAPFLYYQPINRFSIKASYFYNEGKNIIEDNGYLVNNSFDLTTSRTSLLTNFQINKRVSLFGLYQFEKKVEAVQSFNYNYNVFVVGLKFIP